MKRLRFLARVAWMTLTGHEIYFDADTYGWRHLPGGHREALTRPEQVLLPDGSLRVVVDDFYAGGIE